VNHRLRRGVAVAALALALSATGAGCGAGFDPAVNLVQPSNVDAELGDLLARGLVLVKSEDGAAAALVGVLVNRGAQADTLTGIQVGESAAAPTLQPSLALPPGQAVQLGGAEGEQITVAGATDLELGHFVPVTLTFGNAGDLQVDLLVENAGHFYRQYAPEGSPAPTGEPTADSTAEPTPTPEPTPTSEPTQSPVPAPSPY